MKNIPSISFLLVSFLFILSCVKHKSVSSNDQKSYVEEKKQCEVKVLHAFPEGKYTEVGRCTVTDEINVEVKKKRNKRALVALENCVCSKGGNAIVIKQSDSHVVEDRSYYYNSNNVNYQIATRKRVKIRLSGIAILIEE